MQIPHRAPLFLVTSSINGRILPLMMCTYSTRVEYVYHETPIQRLQILYECHDSPSAGHPGICKTYAHLQRNFYWPGMHKGVEGYVMQCQKCQVNKAERLKAGGILHPLEIPNGKWESISMDFIVGFPNTNRGHDSIWVILDWLT